MFDLIDLKLLCRKGHWFSLLLDFSYHPLKELILDYGLDSENLFDSSYLFIGNIENKTIVILHFHSSLNRSMKFMDMQNLNSYININELSTSEKFKLSEVITRDSVLDLSKNNILTKWHLNEINEADYFYLTDETAFVKSYFTNYNRG